MFDLSEEEHEQLKEMVAEWISEGFTTPPYQDAIYSIFEKLGLTPEDLSGACSYDIRRPEARP